MKNECTNYDETLIKKQSFQVANKILIKFEGQFSHCKRSFTKNLSTET